MLCEKCPARVTGGCFISKKRVTRCDKTEAEIKRARDVLLISHDLDKIATRYITDKDMEACNEWWEKLKEVRK